MATDEGTFPALVVFDLDDCLWSPEMFQLRTIPKDGSEIRGPLPGGVGEGVVGVKSGSHVIKMFDGAVVALQRIHAGGLPGSQIAAASTADTPLAVKIGRSAMSRLEVVPGVTMLSMFETHWKGTKHANLLVGRQAPLSSSKKDTHFPILKEQSGLPYHEMVFYDDGNWTDHPRQVATLGVTTVRTPDGMTEELFDEGLRKWASVHGRK